MFESIEVNFVGHGAKPLFKGCLLEGWWIACKKYIFGHFLAQCHQTTQLHEPCVGKHVQGEVGGAPRGVEVLQGLCPVRNLDI